MLIINDCGKFQVSLEDDGTLDTVIGVWHESHGTKDVRFSDCSEYRDDTGAMTNLGFRQLAEEAVDEYIERYLI